MPVKYFLKNANQLQLPEQKIHWIALLGSLTEEDFLQFKNKFDSYLASEQPFRVVFDLRSVSHIPLDLVYRQAKYMASHRMLAKQKIGASVVLVDSLMVKGMIKLIFSLQPPVSPNLVTRNLAEVMPFLDEFL